MAVITSKELVESGAHFGHKARDWNPKMKPYIYTKRKDTHVIDLQKSSQLSTVLYDEILKTAKKGEILFVGTKKQASDIIRDVATRVGQPYAENRWLGGTLTNMKTIRKRVERLEYLEKLIESDEFSAYTKKEQMLLTKEKDKLLTFLGGIRNMKKLPAGIFVVDSNKEKNAILEAKKLGIKVFGIADTVSDPDDFDFFIPANDDAIKAIDLIVNRMADAVVEAHEGKGALEQPTNETVTETKE